MSEVTNVEYGLEKIFEGAKDFLPNNQTIIHTYACPRPTNLLFTLKTTF